MAAFAKSWRGGARGPPYSARGHERALWSSRTYAAPFAHALASRCVLVGGLSIFLISVASMRRRSLGGYPARAFVA
jgi:hypothetical protein